MSGKREVVAWAALATTFVCAPDLQFFGSSLGKVQVHSRDQDRCKQFNACGSAKAMGRTWPNTDSTGGGIPTRGGTTSGGTDCTRTSPRSRRRAASPRSPGARVRLPLAVPSAKHYSERHSSFLPCTRSKWVCIRSSRCIRPSRWSTESHSHWRTEGLPILPKQTSHGSCARGRDGGALSLGPRMLTTNIQ